MHQRRGIVLKLLATLCATAMVACVRALDGALPTGEVVFFRSVFALLPLVLWFGLRGRLRESVRTDNLPGHLMRGIAGTCGMYLNYLSLAFLPLAQATAFSYAAPLFTVILAAVLLREVVRAYRWSAVAAGLVGVIVMLAPAIFGGAAAGAGFLPGAVAALASAACAALSAIQIRRMTAAESASAIVFWFAVMTTVVGGATAVFGWALPDARQMALMIGCGLFGGLGQVLVTLALRESHASLLAPFDYMTMIWSVAVGYAVFATLPDGWTLAGAAIVVAAGLFTLWREAQLKARARAGGAPATTTLGGLGRG